MGDSIMTTNKQNYGIAESEPNVEDRAPKPQFFPPRPFLVDSMHIKSTRMPSPTRIEVQLKGLETASQVQSSCISSIEETVYTNQKLTQELIVQLRESRDEMRSLRMALVKEEPASTSTQSISEGKKKATTSSKQKKGVVVKNAKQGPLTNWTEHEVICNSLEVPDFAAKNVVKLLDEGCTIRFIARYRKEKTGEMEVQKLRDICSLLEDLRAVISKLESVRNVIESAGKMTPELDTALRSAKTMTEVEDLVQLGLMGTSPALGRSPAISPAMQQPFPVPSSSQPPKPHMMPPNAIASPSMEAKPRLIPGSVGIPTPKKKDKPVTQSAAGTVPPSFPVPTAAAMLAALPSRSVPGTASNLLKSLATYNQEDQHTPSPAAPQKSIFKRSSFTSTPKITEQKVDKQPDPAPISSAAPKPFSNFTLTPSQTKLSIELRGPSIQYQQMQGQLTMPGPGFFAQNRSSDRQVQPGICGGQTATRGQLGLMGTSPALGRSPTMSPAMQQPCPVPSSSQPPKPHMMPPNAIASPSMEEKPRLIPGSVGVPTPKKEDKPVTQSSASTVPPSLPVPTSAAMLAALPSRSSPGTASNLLKSLAAYNQEDQHTPSSAAPQIPRKSIFKGFTFTSTPKVTDVKVDKQPDPAPFSSAAPKIFSNFTLTPSQTKPTPPAGQQTTQQPQSAAYPFVLAEGTPALLFGSLDSGSAEAFKASGDFKGFQCTGQQMFSDKSPSPRKGNRILSEDDKVEEYEPNIDFKPVVELPDLVDVNTGEEEEDKLFGERAKLFRFDQDANQWKERGIGEFKLLRHKETGRVRVLMRHVQCISTDSNDVIFIKEETSSAEDIAKARMFYLPDNFYLYHSRPSCPGCIGCGDGEGILDNHGEVDRTADDTVDDYDDYDDAEEDSEDYETAEEVTDEGEDECISPDAKSGTSYLAHLLSPEGKEEADDTGFVFGGGQGAGFSFASLAASADPEAFSGDADKPFHWRGAGKQLFGAGVSSTADTGDDDGVQQGDVPHFEPIVPLPDLVDVKTGEEDEVAEFCHRAKLFRYDTDAKQWKEKGIGEMKILCHRETGKYRFLLRREQVHKLACNHLLTPDLSITKLSTSETSWCWTAQDFSDGEPRVEQLAVKFKTIELAHQFKDKVDSIQQLLSDGSS